MNPSSPHWELDIVGYSDRDNMLRVVECKSYLDSRGLALRAFDGSDAKFAERFKLFSDDTLRAVVFERQRTPLQWAIQLPCEHNLGSLPEGPGGEQLKTKRLGTASRTRLSIMASQMPLHLRTSSTASRIAPWMEFRLTKYVYLSYGMTRMRHGNDRTGRETVHGPKALRPTLVHFRGALRYPSANWNMIPFFLLIGTQSFFIAVSPS